MLLLAMPGPTNALLAAAGAARGVGNAFALLAAESAGYAIALMLLLSLNEIAGSFRGEIGTALRASAAIILLVTAWRMWRSAGTSDGSGKPRTAPGAGNIFLLTLFNPKAPILGFAIFPSVVAEGALFPAAVLFSAIVAVTGLGWILVGAATRKLPGQPHLVVARVSSLVIAGFACYFVALVVAELTPLMAA
jgi:threonine/homoserine/homoserine lactone efflux protein